MGRNCQNIKVSKSANRSPYRAPGNETPFFSSTPDAGTGARDTAISALHRAEHRAINSGNKEPHVLFINSLLTFLGNSGFPTRFFRDMGIIYPRDSCYFSVDMVNYFNNMVLVVPEFQMGVCAMVVSERSVRKALAHLEKGIASGSRARGGGFP
jgi:hypothetical protein